MNESGRSIIVSGGPDSRERHLFRFSLDANGGFDFWCPVEIASDTIFEVRLRCDAEFNASRAGQGGDERDLAYHLNAMELSHEAGPGTSGDVERRSGR